MQTTCFKVHCQCLVKALGKEMPSSESPVYCPDTPTFSGFHCYSVQLNIFVRVDQRFWTLFSWRTPGLRVKTYVSLLKWLLFFFELRLSCSKKRNIEKLFNFDNFNFSHAQTKAPLKEILNAFYKHFDLFDIAWNASHLLTNEASDNAYGTRTPTFRIPGLDNIFVVTAPSAHDYTN